MLIYQKLVRTTEQIQTNKWLSVHFLGSLCTGWDQNDSLLCLCRGHDVQTQGQQRNKTEIIPLMKLARGAWRVQWTEKWITMSVSKSPNSPVAVLALRVGHGEAWPLRGKIEFEMKMASCMWSVRSKCSEGLQIHCVPLKCILELCQISQIQ